MQGMFYQLLIAFSCTGYSSPRNELQYQYTATVFASGSNCMQDDDHAWWKEGVWGGLIADTTLLQCAICDITCYIS